MTSTMQHQATQIQEAYRRAVEEEFGDSLTIDDLTVEPMAELDSTDSFRVTIVYDGPEGELDPAKANRVLTEMMAPLKELGAPPVLMESYVSRQEYEDLQKLSAEPPWNGGMTWSALMDTAKEMAGVSTAPRSSGAGDPERLRNAVNTAYHAMYHALCRSNADAINTKSQHPLSELTWTITYMAVGHRQARKRLAEMERELSPPARRFAAVFTLMQIHQEAAVNDPRVRLSRGNVITLVNRAETATEEYLAIDQEERRVTGALVII